MKQAKKKDPIAPFLPIIGLVIIVLAGGFAYLVSGPAHDFLRSQLGSQIPNEPVVQYAIAGMIFLLIVLVVGMVFAAFQPKPEMTVSERQLDKEKKEREKERLERKKRQRLMKEKMRKANKRQQ